jgi:UDP-N-acetylglucosamine 2-epimerase (non-hydrolysing)
MILVNTGQHYDAELSDLMFEVLKLPEPQYNLQVGSGTHAVQTGKIMIALEKLLIQNMPDLVVAQGDTNTVLAAALAAVKAHIPFAHIEAGLRSYDRSMPEELNRVLVDHCSEIHFAPTVRSAINLIQEGCNPTTIHITGNTVVDAILKNKDHAFQTSKILESLDLQANSYAVVTIHRPANVDKKDVLDSILSSLLRLTKLKLVFPLHPRTQKNLKKFGLYQKLKQAPNVVLTKPLGYLDFLRLMGESALIITDSGGLQEEAFTLGKPCITLRSNTERPESIPLGANYLVGRDPDQIERIANQILADSSIIENITQQNNPFGDGNADSRIIEAIAQFCSGGRAFSEPLLLETGTINTKLYPVGEEFHGKTVKQAETKLEGQIQLIYHSDGHPLFPTPNYELHKGQFLLLAIGK